MNPTAILALISDLYDQLSKLTEDNAALRRQLGQLPPSPSEGVTEGE